MAIFKATYTKNVAAAKASIRYIAHRPGKEGKKLFRILWGWDGQMERSDAYHMIDEAKQGSVFFRFVISPDPMQEDTYKDISLRDVTEQTMIGIEDRLRRQVQFVAAMHDDHAPHRHVHILAILPRKLQVQDLLALRQTATDAALQQRHQRDAIREAQQQQERGNNAQWEWQR